MWREHLKCTIIWDEFWPYARVTRSPGVGWSRVCFGALHARGRVHWLEEVQYHPFIQAWMVGVVMQFIEFTNKHVIAMS